MELSERVAVVIGSTRPGRICPGIAEWVAAVAQEGSPLRYEQLDLASFVTYGTRGGNKAAQQFHEILQGLHMQELHDHLEISITPDDVDDRCQLKDLHTTLGPYREQTRAINGQMVEALHLG